MPRTYANSYDLKGDTSASEALEACEGYSIRPCRGMPYVVFFGEAGRGGAWRYETAAALCATCSVRPECLAAALAEESGDKSYRFGYRGGMSPTDREDYVRTLRNVGKLPSLKAKRRGSIMTDTKKRCPLCEHPVSSHLGDRCHVLGADIKPCSCPLEYALLMAFWKEQGVKPIIQQPRRLPGRRRSKNHYDNCRRCGMMTRRDLLWLEPGLTRAFTDWVCIDAIYFMPLRKLLERQSTRVDL